jgi:hypothetical protein
LHALCRATATGLTTEAVIEESYKSAAGLQNSYDECGAAVPEYLTLANKEVSRVGLVLGLLLGRYGHLEMHFGR